MVVLAESAIEKKPPAALDLARQEVEGEFVTWRCCNSSLPALSLHCGNMSEAHLDYELPTSVLVVYLHPSLPVPCFEQMVKMTRRVDSAFS